jgi:hypothetical protein
LHEGREIEENACKAATIFVGRMKESSNTNFSKAQN